MTLVPLSNAELAERAIQRLQRMDARKRERFLLRVEGIGTLTDSQRAWVDQYAIDFNATAASKRLEYVRPHSAGIRMLRDKAVAAAAEKRMAEQELVSELKAEYVREYLRDVLDFCPTEFFQPAPDGGWEIAADKYNGLPKKVLRLIEEVELRVKHGVSYLAIKFVSKGQALTIAARYTLTQKVEATVKTVPWDQLLPGASELDDPIERRIAEVARGAAAAHNAGSDTVPVAALPPV